LIFGWSWLKNFSLLHPPQRFIVQFHDVAGLNNNAPVNVNGVRVGTIEKLSLKKKGQVLVSLKINTEEVTIPLGSNFTIQTLGLVGSKYMEITLPDEKPGEPAPPPLDPSNVVIGQDPVRVELVANKIATNLSRINFSDVEGTMSKNMERMAKAADSVQVAANKFGGVAEEARGAATNANQFFARGTRSFDKIDQVANGSRTGIDHFTAFTDDWRTTSRKLNKILDNPALSSDLKETAEKARQTAEMVQNTFKDLNKTLQDQPLRVDLLTALDRLNTSTDNVYKSVQIVQKVSVDQGLRTDVKSILAQTRETMTKVSELVNQPGFATDMRATMTKVQKASDDVDTVARQLHQVLDQKHPLWKMMTSSPGKLKVMPAVPVVVPAPVKNEQLVTPQDAGVK